MRTVYHDFVSEPDLAFPNRFQARWDRVEPLLRLHFAPRDDNEHLDTLLEEARQHLSLLNNREPFLMESCSDSEWVKAALRGVLRIDETQPLFEKQFQIIEKRLHHWARQHFKAELVDDVVQSAFIKLWDDYQRHQQEWDAKTESFWVSCGKLAMRSAYRDLRMQTEHRKGSSRRHEQCEWIQHQLSEHEFILLNEGDDRNDVLDMLSQNADSDIHGADLRRANLRLDLETLLYTVKQHYRPAIFERCLLVLERLVEGYTPAEIRLELGWTTVTYESTTTLIRRMSRFTEDYHRAPNRYAKLSDSEIGRIHALRQAGCTQQQIERRTGRNLKTVWLVLQPTDLA